MTAKSVTASESLTAKQRIGAPASRKIGRPTRKEAERLHNELLDGAFDLFLDRGFEQTTLEGIAASLGTTKRTLYARYPDKTSLFKAAVRRAIDRFTISPADLEPLDDGDLASTLTRVAHVRVEHVLSPIGLRLQRILNTEAYRFPEIYNEALERGTKPIIDFIAGVIRRHLQAGTATVANPERAATIFLTIVASGPLRLITANQPLTEDEIARRVEMSVEIFLYGIASR